MTWYISIRYSMYMTSKGYGESMIPPQLPTFRSPYRYATGLWRETDILLAYMEKYVGVMYLIRFVWLDWR